jgi:hypothetical protein
MTRTGWTAVVSALVLVAFSLAPCRATAQEKSPSEFYKYFPEWDRAIGLKDRVQTAKLDQKLQLSLVETFSGLEKRHAVLFEGTDPLFVERGEYRRALEVHNLDASNQRKNADSIKAEVEATPVEQRTKAWAEQMNRERVIPSNEWEKKIRSKKRELDVWKVGLDRQTVELYKKWVDQLGGFIEDANLALGMPIPLLSVDPSIAGRCVLRLEQVQGRIGRLQKAVQLLGRDNPQWDKEYQELRNRSRHDAQETLLKSFDMLTLDLAEIGRITAEQNVKVAKNIYDSSLWGELLVQERKLITKAAGSSGAEAAALQNTIAAMKRLEKARDAEHWTEAGAIVRKALFDGKEIHEKAAGALGHDDLADALYDGSCAMGQIGIMFVKGVGGKVAPGAELVARGIEVGLLVKLASEDWAQIKALGDRSYDRETKKRELQGKLEDLENEKTILEWAVERASGSTRKQ